MDRRVAGDLTHVLPGVLDGSQRDQQGGGGRGGQHGEPAVVHHDELPSSDVVGGAVLHSLPGENHRPQSVHLTLQASRVARSHRVDPRGRHEDRQEGGRLLLQHLYPLSVGVGVVLLVILVVVSEEI